MKWMLLIVLILVGCDQKERLAKEEAEKRSREEAAANRDLLAGRGEPVPDGKGGAYSFPGLFSGNDSVYYLYNGEAVRVKVVEKFSTTLPTALDPKTVSSAMKTYEKQKAKRDAEENQ